MTLFVYCVHIWHFPSSSTTNSTRDFVNRLCKEFILNPNYRIDSPIWNKSAISVSLVCWEITSNLNLVRIGAKEKKNLKEDCLRTWAKKEKCG